MPSIGRHRPLTMLLTFCSSPLALAKAHFGLRRRRMYLAAFALFALCFSASAQNQSPEENLAVHGAAAVVGEGGFEAGADVLCAEAPGGAVTDEEAGAFGGVGRGLEAVGGDFGEFGEVGALEAEGWADCEELGDADGVGAGVGEGAADDLDDRESAEFGA